EARAAAAQAQAEYEQRKHGYLVEDIAPAQANLDRAKGEKVRTHADFDRYDALAKKDLVSKQQRDTAEANWKVAAAQEQNAQDKLDQLRHGYRPEEIAPAEAHSRKAQPTQKKFKNGPP